MIIGVLIQLAIVFLIIKAVASCFSKKYKVLQKLIPIWEEINIITQEQGSAILNLYNLKRTSPKRKMDMVKILTLVGAIFIGVGVIFFVASNWQGIPTYIKTILLLTITVFTLRTGYFFSYEKENFAILGKNLLLLSALFWGGTVALIAQIYNIPVSQNWLIMLIWAFPIVPIAIFFDNEHVHILASIAFLIWNFLYTVNNYTANYFYPLIIFFIMLPSAKKLLLSSRINIAGLLIAAIYCCFNKYDSLSLLISAGLLAYYLLRKEERAYLYASCLSFICWAITFFTVHQTLPNFFFLAPLTILFYISYKEKIKENIVLCLFAALTWINLTLQSFCKLTGNDFNPVNFIIFQSLAGMAIYIAGIISKNKNYPFPEIYKIFGYIATFISMYFLSFQSLLDSTAAKMFNQVYYFGCLFLIAAITILLLDRIRKGHFKDKAAQLELAALITALLGNALLLLSPGAFFSTIIANAVLVIFAIINIALGVELKTSSIFTSGTIIFALFIITRYIDAGWRLKDKSLFFIVGGMLILALGIILEKQRRKMLERMK